MSMIQSDICTINFPSSSKLEIRLGDNLDMEGMSVTFNRRIKRVRKKGKCQRKRHENEGLLVVFRSLNIACNVVLQFPLEI